jgi:ElaB/YqjD/DUF883 family membrane-anchored ribosome-binding protein
MGETSNTDDLKANIDQTRADIGRTLDAIGDKLSPRTMARDAAESVKETAYSIKDAAATKAEAVMATAADRAGELVGKTRDTIAGIGDQMGGRPWPAFLIAAGIGWGVYRAFSGSPNAEDDGYSPRWYEEHEEDNVAADNGRSQGTTLATRVTRASRRAPGELTRIVRENPLLVGIAAAAIGAAIGMSIPETDAERQLVDVARESMMSGGEGFAGSIAP